MIDLRLVEVVNMSIGQMMELKMKERERRNPKKGQSRQVRLRLRPCGQGMGLCLGIARRPRCWIAPEACRGPHHAADSLARSCPSKANVAKESPSIILHTNRA